MNRPHLPLVLVLSSSMLAACGSAPPAPPASAPTTSSSSSDGAKEPTSKTDAPVAVAVQADESHDGKTLEAKVGGTIVLTLGENPSTGYSWVAAKEPDAAVLKIETSAMKDGPGAPMPGKPGSHTWTLRAVGAGTATLKLDLMPPGTGTSASKSFTLTIRVSA